MPDRLTGQGADGEGGRPVFVQKLEAGAMVACAISWKLAHELHANSSVQPIRVEVCDGFYPSCPGLWPAGRLSRYPAAPQHFLNFLPLPQGQGSLRPTLASDRT